MIIHLVFSLALLFLIPEINRYVPLYILTFITLFLVLVFRYDYGNDYSSYYSIYENIKIGAYSDVESLYYLFNLYSPSFHVLVALFSFLYILVFYFFIKKNLTVEQYWFACLIWLINPYLFLVHLSTFRQTIAICLFIVAVYFMIKRSFIKYLIIIIIAMNFHMSAVILIPLYFFVNMNKVTFKQKITLCILLMLCLMTPLIDIILSYFLQFFHVNYRYYYEQARGNSIRATILSSFYFFLILINLHKLEGKHLIFGKLSLVATIISLLAYKVSMLTRIGMYFDVFLILTIPMIFSVIKNRSYKLILFLIMLLIYILRYYSFFTGDIFGDHYQGYNVIFGLKYYIDQ